MEERNNWIKIKFWHREMGVLGSKIQKNGLKEYTILINKYKIFEAKLPKVFISFSQQTWVVEEEILKSPILLYILQPINAKLLFQIC